MEEPSPMEDPVANPLASEPMSSTEGGHTAMTQSAAKTERTDQSCKSKLSRIFIGLGAVALGAVSAMAFWPENLPLEEDDTPPLGAILELSWLQVPDEPINCHFHASNTSFATGKDHHDALVEQLEEDNFGRLVPYIAFDDASGRTVVTQRLYRCHFNLTDEDNQTYTHRFAITVSLA